MMDVDVIDSTDEKVEFVIDGIDPAFANAMRRSMIGEVPILAIDEVDFYKNNSALYNEVLAHRMALTPLKFDPEALSLRDECDCDGEGCVQCEVVFTVKAEGPTVVYAEDLDIKNEDVEPYYGEIPLVYLTEGQEIDAEGVARLGRGKNHSKWQGAVSAYRYYPHVELKEGLPEDKAREIVDVCPTDVFERSGRGAKVADEEACILCDACVEAAPEHVTVEGDENKFIFKVDTASGLGPGQVAVFALDVMESKAESFRDEISEYA